jgi:RNA polymerase sigma-70 factor (ECF subfamily)
MTHPRHSLDRHIVDLRRYSRALMRNPHDAEELVQECLLRALGRRHFWPRIDDMRAYLFSILHNAYIDRVTHEKRSGSKVPIDDAAGHLAHPASQHSSLELKEVSLMLGRLPAEQQQVLLLVGVEGMTYQQSAIILNVPVGTVMSRLARGREALRRLMDGDAAAPLRAAH